MFFQLGKNTDRECLFCSNVSTLLSMIVGIKKLGNFHVSQQLLSMIVDKHAGISFIYQIQFAKNSRFTDFDLFFVLLGNIDT